MSNIIYENLVSQQTEKSTCIKPFYLDFSLITTK